MLRAAEALPFSSNRLYKEQGILSKVAGNFDGLSRDISNQQQGMCRSLRSRRGQTCNRVSCIAHPVRPSVGTDPVVHETVGSAMQNFC